MLSNEARQTENESLIAESQVVSMPSTWQLMMPPDLNTNFILPTGTMKVCPDAERPELP